MDSRSQRVYKVSSLEKALAVLDLFDVGKTGLSLSEIAQKLNTRPGTIYPTVQTLIRFGYLRQDGHKRYHLGLKFFERTHAALESLDLYEKAKPVLKELALSCKANAHLAVLYGRQVLYLHREEGYPSAIIKDIVGHRVPAYCTGLGKVLLAALSEAELERFLAQEELKALTPHTIIDPERLKEELNLVRIQGYAIDNEEFAEGNVCFAAPIRDHRHRVVAAISIALPKLRAVQAKEALIEKVTTAAHRISEEIGYSGGR